MTPEIEKQVQDLLPQARSEAWRIFQTAPQQLDRDELQSLAYTGLVMAANRWETYCEANGYSPDATQFFAAYALRRMRGAMLDAMRSSDWVTRSVRSRAKALREAGHDLGKSEDELSEATGLTKQQIRDTLAGVARRPVSVDAEPVDIAEQASVEGTAVVHSVMDAVVEVLRAKPAEVQIIIALRYHQGKELREIAALLGRTPDEVDVLHAEGILAVHDAMIRMVSDSGGSV
jgi:RNA polymerase sigma factor FliA